MSKIALDLKKFKHIKSDDASTTLQHNDGHILTVAHKALSPEFREQLECLPKSEDHEDSYSKGGDVLDSGSKKGISTQGEDVRRSHGLKLALKKPHPGLEHVDENSKKMATQHDKWAKTEAKGRAEFERVASKPKLKGLAQGGSVPQGPCLNPNCKSHGKPHPNCRCYSAFAKGGEVKHVCSTKSKHYPDCEYYASGGLAEPKYERLDPVKAAQAQKGAQQSESLSEGYNNIKKEVGSWFGSKKAEGGEVKMYADPEEEVSPDDQAPTVSEAPPAALQANAPEEEPKDIQKIVDDASFVPAPTKSGIAPETPQEEAPKQEEKPLAPDVAKEQPPAIMKQGLAEPGTGDANSNPLARQAKTFDQHKQEKQQELMQSDAAWANDLANGHITPMTYSSMFANKDTLGKVGTIFGLLLSGAGSGLSHQPNALLAMMNQTISNDLEAQKQSKQNAQNYLRIAQQHEMQKANINHLNAETAMTANGLARQYMNRSALQSMIDQVNRMPKGSPERANAEAQLAIINQGVQNENFDIGQKMATASALFNAGGGNSNAEGDFQKRNRALEAGAAGPQGQILAKYDTEHHVPGLPGRTTLPIPEDERKNLNSMELLDNKVKDVIDYAKKHAGSVDPKVVATAKQKAEELTSFYNKSVDSLGMTQGRLSWLEEQIKKNPTSLIQQLSGNNSRLQEIQNSNAARKQLKLKQFGYTPGQSESKSESQQMSKSGKPIELVNGKWVYKK